MDQPTEKPEEIRISDIEHGHDRTEKPVSGKNGLDIHEKAVLTPEEARAERRYVLKLDFIVLPLIAVMYFLATLVRILLDAHSDCLC